MLADNASTLTAACFWAGPASSINSLSALADLHNQPTDDKSRCRGSISPPSAVSTPRFIAVSCKMCTIASFVSPANCQKDNKVINIFVYFAQNNSLKFFYFGSGTYGQKFIYFAQEID
jgi:hypothetical protein